MQELIQLLKKKDHWELLASLSERLSVTSEIVNTIGVSLEGREIGAVRRELPPQLVEAAILIEVLKVKLSVMPDEWKTYMDISLESWKEENKPKNKFDDEEF